MFSLGPPPGSRYKVGYLPRCSPEQAVCNVCGQIGYPPTGWRQNLDISTYECPRCHETATLPKRRRSKPNHR